MAEWRDLEREQSAAKARHTRRVKAAVARSHVAMVTAKRHAWNEWLKHTVIEAISLEFIFHRFHRRE
jgi:hypothetical protein